MWSMHTHMHTLKKAIMFTPKAPSYSASPFSYKNTEEKDKTRQLSIPKTSMSYIFIGIICILSLKRFCGLCDLWYGRDWTSDSKSGGYTEEFWLHVDFEQMINCLWPQFFHLQNKIDLFFQRYAENFQTCSLWERSQIRRIRVLTAKVREEGDSADPHKPREFETGRVPSLQSLKSWSTFSLLKSLDNATDLWQSPCTECREKCDTQPSDGGVQRKHLFTRPWFPLRFFTGQSEWHAVCLGQRLLLKVGFLILQCSAWPLRWVNFD